MQSNRRKFMTTLAGVGASLAIAGCSGTEESTETPTEDGGMTEGDSMENESMTEGGSMEDGGMTEGGSMDEGGMTEGDSMEDGGMNESTTDTMN